jgi:hypothetical protein
MLSFLGRSHRFSDFPANPYQARAVNRQKSFIMEIFPFRLAAAGSVVRPTSAAQPIRRQWLATRSFSLFDASAGLPYL